MNARTYAKIAMAYAVFAVVASGAAQAASDLDTCIGSRIEKSEDPSVCVDPALTECTAIVDAQGAVAALCYKQAKDSFGAQIKAALNDVKSTAAEDIATITAIETKYDILSGLMQCDRLEELARAVSDQTADSILREKSRCEAMTLGLGYVRLKLRAEGIK